MTENETKTLLAEIDANYPAAFKDMSKEQKKRLIGSWLTLYQDTDVELVRAAFYTFLAVDQKGFAPKPGQLNKIIYDNIVGEKMSEMQAWEIVRKAIKNSAYHADEEWKKFPQEIQKIVTPGQLRAWAIEEHGNESVNASNFMRSYRANISRDERYLKLSGEMSGLIENIANKVIEGI